MPSTPMALMIPTHVADHPPLHEWTERGFGRWLRDYDKMRVVRHEAQAEDVQRELFLGGSEELDKGEVVTVLMENGCLTIPSIQHMVGVSADLSAPCEWC